MTRHPARREAGFSLVEALVAVTILGVVGVGLAGLMTRSARGATQSSAQAYQTAFLTAELARVSAVPAAALTAGTTCDTTVSAPWDFQRCTTVTNVTSRQQRIRVVIRAIDGGTFLRPDTVVIERASNIGALDLSGGT